MLTNALLNFALSGAIAMSQASASEQPAPAAMPLTAAITGCGSARICRITGL
jgi:hypothetical protein